MRRVLIPAVAALALIATALTPAVAEEAKAAYRIGETVADFTAKDVGGTEWKLAAAHDLTEEATLAAVRTAAAAYGGKADAKAEDELASLSGLKGADGALDPALRLEFARAAGRSFGLVPSEKAVEGWKTIGDAAAGIRSASKSPIVLLWWSPKCATSARYEDRIVELFAQTGARVFPVATNHADDDASIQAYLKAKGLPYRVLLDREAVLADKFGAKRTPHVFVIDDKKVLRYSGAIDNDKEDRRADWLLDALKAVSDGAPVEVLMTEAKG